MKLRHAARQLDVDEKTFYDWERSRSTPRPRYLPRIVEFLGYNPLPRVSSFADSIRRLTEVMGVSQRELAELLGVSQGAISHWLNGDNCAYPHVAAKLKELLEKEGIQVSEPLSLRIPGYKRGPYQTETKPRRRKGSGT